MLWKTTPQITPKKPRTIKIKVNLKLSNNLPKRELIKLKSSRKPVKSKALRTSHSLNTIRLVRNVQPIIVRERSRETTRTPRGNGSSSWT